MSSKISPKKISQAPLKPVLQLRPKMRRDKSRDKAAAKVGFAKALLEHYKSSVQDEAVIIHTPFAECTPLLKVSAPAPLRRAIEAYEPKVAVTGLYRHQVDCIQAFRTGGPANYILTTATGSGKSLCFWAWTFQILLEDPRATVLLCFPTQALMWGQAERLSRMSHESGDALAGWGGKLKLGSKNIAWTIWKGSGRGVSADREMKIQEQSSVFSSARIRLATLDKAHFSLLRDKHGFLENLAGIVLDEAHTYQGVFGANVHWFLKRVFAAQELLGKKRSKLFLASATVSDPITFGMALASIEARAELKHIPDSVEQSIEKVPVKRALDLLSNPPRDGLYRVVLLLDQSSADYDAKKGLSPVLRGNEFLDGSLNCIYFSQSKLHSKMLAIHLREKGPNPRQIVTYDADLPPHRRRLIEESFNSGKTTNTTLIATNALELGVDIEGLDICVIDEVPPARHDLLQRIGRVGRRTGETGLVVIAASLRPNDRQLLEEPKTALRLDTTRLLPIPLHLDLIRLKHLLAAVQGERFWRTYGNSDWPAYCKIMCRYFGEAHPTKEQTIALMVDAYGTDAEEAGSDQMWAHNGFRASMSRGKIPLAVFSGKYDAQSNPVAESTDGKRKDIAWIEDSMVFRDAHPEAIFLAHDGTRWQVAAYGGEWKVAKHAPSGSDYVLGKWLRSVDCVYVKRCTRNVTTRGDWRERYEAYTILTDLPGGSAGPVEGRFEFGLWDYYRKWTGYQLIDLKTKKRTKVSLQEVMERFQQAIRDKSDFPFLHELTFRTFGWRWDLGNALTRIPGQSITELQRLQTDLFSTFLRNELQCAPCDITLEICTGGRALTCFDNAPGGNGLSAAFLQEGRMEHVLSQVLTTLNGFRGRSASREFRTYCEQLLNMSVEYGPEDVKDGFQKLYDRWHGQTTSDASRRSKGRIKKP